MHREQLAGLEKAHQEEIEELKHSHAEEIAKLKVYCYIATIRVFYFNL